MLNAGDPDPLTVREIGATILALVGHEAAEILIDGDPPSRSVGDTPWSVARSVVMDIFAYFFANQGDEAFGYAAEDQWVAGRH